MISREPRSDRNVTRPSVGCAFSTDAHVCGSRDTRDLAAVRMTPNRERHDSKTFEAHSKSPPLDPPPRGRGWSFGQHVVDGQSGGGARRARARYGPRRRSSSPPATARSSPGRADPDLGDRRRRRSTASACSPIADLTQRAPGLTATTPNARRTGVSLRGIGKTSGNDNMEAAVGVIVDDVFLDHVGMTYQDFTDLEQVEILRGPQGTLLGKNTSLGVIKYTSRAADVHARGVVRGRSRARERSASKARGSYSDALIDDLLAYPRLVLHRQAGGRHPSTSTPPWAGTGTSGPLGRPLAAAARAERRLLAQAQPRHGRDRREQQHQAVHGRPDDAQRRLGARRRPTPRVSRAAISAATRRSSARGTRSTSTRRSRW